MRRSCIPWSPCTSARIGLLLIGLSAAAFASSSQEKLNLASSYYEEAENARLALQETPAEQRSLRDYLRVIQAFRRVYLTAPGYSNNAKSLMAIGELYQTMASNFNKKKYLVSAAKTYDFLIREYPHSRYRAQALLTCAQIYHSDLTQPEEARRRFEIVLKEYARSEQAVSARAGIAEIEAQAAAKKAASEPAAATVKQPDSQLGSSGLPQAMAGSSEADSAAVQEERSKVAQRPPAPPRVPVTDVRHWIAPGSTRIVIDLGGEVKYQVERLSNPPRIYVDLYGTSIDRAVSREVARKNFSDGALVTGVRAGQNNSDVTRVVAQMAREVDYSVFDLPNPYRLIIEVREPKKPQAAISEQDSAKKIDGPIQPSIVDSGKKTGREVANVPNARRDVKGQSQDREGAVVPQARPDVKQEPKPPNQSASQMAAPAQPAAIIAPAAEPKRDSAAVLQPAVVSSNESTSQKPNDVPTFGPPIPEKIQTPQVRTEGASAAASVPVEKPVLTAKRPAGQGQQSNASAMGSVQNDDKSTTAAGESTQAPQPAPEQAPTRVAPSAPAQAKNGRSVGGLADVRPAQPTRNGTRSLTRALGLKIGRIILDPGHGGHDTGTIGPGGLCEKDLVLDIAQRLGKLVTDRLGSEVIYTREDDTFVPLESRTAIANDKQADLFLSIHANSSPSPSARGIETYYLSFNADPEAMEVAARENAVSQESVYQLQDLVKKIALNDKIDESKEFAIEVQTALHSRLSKDSEKRKNRGVKKAPFRVLVGPKMPSVLAEIAFLSNPQEEKLLRKKQQRQKVAEALYVGIERYVDTLSGVRVARSETSRETVAK